MEATEDRQLHVLVVEDDGATRTLIASTVRDAGYRVTVARDGAEALRVIETLGPPNAVILDLEMPVMDGRACFRALRARGIASPVLVVSGKNARTAAAEIGATAALEKPFEPDELLYHLTVVVA